MRIPPLFNCSNDMALAANLRQYLPPRRIQVMEEQLTSLARFWDEGPWGWSLATKTRYRHLGVPEEDLPSDEQIARIRQLSSREFACEYIEKLLTEARREGLSDSLLGDEMHFATQLQQCAEATFPQIYKSPWSSSGRGIVVAEQWDEESRQRVAGFLRTQGGCCMDRFYANKQQDLAMEFFVHPDHQVEFLGYSLFETGEHGAYSGNWVLPQSEIRAKIEAPEEVLQWLIRYHLWQLQSIDYQGPVGIDMITSLEDGVLKVHPVIEINLRMNMGILAILLERQGITEDQPLTPPLDHGFTARIRDKKLVIEFVR